MWFSYNDIPVDTRCQGRRRREKGGEKKTRPPKEGEKGGREWKAPPAAGGPPPAFVHYIVQHLRRHVTGRRATVDAAGCRFLATESDFSSRQGSVPRSRRGTRGTGRSGQPEDSRRLGGKSAFPSASRRTCGGTSGYRTAPRPPSCRSAAAGSGSPAAASRG